MFPLQYAAAAICNQLFLSTVAFLARFLGNSPVPTYFKDQSSVGRSRAHPLHDFVALGRFPKEIQAALLALGSVL